VEPPSDTNSIYYDVLEIIEEYILPSLAMLESPCAFSEEIWGLMKLLPYNIRYYTSFFNLFFSTSSLIYYCHYNNIYGDFVAKIITDFFTPMK
jgi:hypothetical protein